MILLTAFKVHDISRMGDHMMHFLRCLGQGIEVQLLIRVWPCHKSNKITLSVRNFHWLFHYSVIIGVI